MAKTPYPHQLEASEYLANGGSYLFMEPRTGKTLSTILAIKALGLRALILAPKSVLPVWRDELEAEGEKAIVIDGTKTKKQKLLAEPGHHIITYESSWRLIHNLSTYGVVVFDEALKLQNGETKTGTHWRKLGRRYPQVRKWGLSGAPCPESPLQLANQMMVLQGSWFKQNMYETYRWLHWDYDERKYKFKPKDPRHAKEATRIFNELSFRKSQKDLGMGEKIFEVRYVNANANEEKLLLHNKSLAKDPYDQSVNYTTEAMYRQAAGSGIDAEAKAILLKKPTKLLEIIDATQDLLEEPATQIVIMVRFTTSGKWLAKKLGVPFIFGETSGRDRERAIKDYQFGQQRVLVCQQEAVKMGIDFSAGGHGVLIYAENSWSGDTFIQSTQRAVNIQRKSPALIITYCMRFKEGCVDEKIYQAVKNKKDFNAKMLQKENT